jgi:hypothetical protein
MIGEEDDRLLKNAHLQRYPAASPSRRRGNKSLLIRRDTPPHPSPYRARGRLVATYIQVRLTPHDFGRLASPCLRVAASAEAGAFLISQQKRMFHQAEKSLTHSLKGKSHI